jgi:GxxExxY protein
VRGEELRLGPGLDVNRISGLIVDGAVCVHRTLGPGLLESVYERCLDIELAKRELKVERQVALPIRYGDQRIDGALRLDLVVEGRVIVEVKAVEQRLPIHEAQLLTYLRLSGQRVGLLINFNVLQLKNGLKRLVNSTPPTPRTSASSAPPR